MNDIIDDTKSTYQQWTLELTAALNLAGFGVQHNGHTGTSNYRLGRLTVSKPGIEDIKYIIELERKVILKGGQRRQIAQLEVYNPVGGLHVHIRNYSAEAIAKVVEYARLSIEKKHARQEQDVARDRRNKEGWEIMRKGTDGFIIPDWVRIRPNIEKDEEVGTFRLLFSDHLMDWPLAKLNIAKAKLVIDAVRAATCDHKFVDSLTCLKCGWAPPVSINLMPPVNVWHAASEPVPPELVNDPNSHTGITKMLLLVVRENDTPVRGWYYGGLLNEFRMDGCPSEVEPLYWMPMPKRPDRKG